MNEHTQPRTVLMNGATGGLGPAVVRKFYANGDNIILTSRKQEELDRTVSELGLDVSRTLLIPIDLTSAEGVEAVVAKSAERFGAIDAVIHITGTWRGGKVVDTEPKDWDFLLGLNLRLAYLVAHAVLPGMLERGSGKMVFVSARYGSRPSGGSTAASVSKAGLESLVKNLAQETRQHGINVNAVAPSTLDTPSGRESMPNADHSKWVAPESLADVMFFLASEGARDIHGAIIPVYGKA